MDLKYEAGHTAHIFLGIWLKKVAKMPYFWVPREWQKLGFTG